MNVALRRPRMAEAEFLAWVERQDRRYEFDGARPVPMVGSTRRHGRLQVRLIAALDARLRATPHEVLGSDTFVRAAGVLRLPDVIVVNRSDSDAGRVIADPIVVFEILSDRTADIDRFEKAQEYWDTPSIQHYVMLEQRRIGAVVLSRGPDGWVRTTVTESAAITLPAVGVSLELADIYEGLRFPEEPSEPADPTA